MPSTIGQVIINARQVVPDMTQVMSSPSLKTATSVNVAGGTLVPGTQFFVQLTSLNQFGESLPSGELTVTIAPGANAIQITYNGPFGQAMGGPSRLYVGSASGGEDFFVPFNDTTGTVNFPNFNNATINGPALPGVPPQRSTAWLPDTDGALIGAFAIYGWLNDGLRLISRFAGGLLDYSGVGSLSNQPYYTVVGEWNEITSIWYDGYWMVGGDRGTFWRRNNITSQILSSATISVINNQMVLEVYPQPARTAAQTTLALAMGATDNTCKLTLTSGFVLPFGFVQVDSEIMAYQKIQSPNLVGLLRGLGGTPAVAHAQGAPVSELNIFWNGKRQIEPAYAPGQSATILPLPSGWDVLLAQYISGRAKNIEHDGQYWKQLQDDIQAQVKQWAKDTKGIMRRRQIGPPSSPATFYADQAGGILIN